MPTVDHGKKIIELEDISFAYDTVSVLKDINLDIHQGDYLGIVGPNGAGKTTLLKIMLGILKPDTGAVKLFGTSIDSFRDRSKIGYVPQKAAAVDANFPANVEEVVLMGRYARRGLFHFVTNEDRELTRTALKQVGMLEYRSRLIGDLSGGQQQRVFIARALVCQPEVIFLDEPTIAVDQKTQDEFYGLLRSLNREFGLTLVLISHDIAVITREVMHIACIDTTLTYLGSPQEFLAHGQVPSIQGRRIEMIPHHHNQ